jgi:hypothetical protein
VAALVAQLSDVADSLAKTMHRHMAKEESGEWSSSDLLFNFLKCLPVLQCLPCLVRGFQGLFLAARSHFRYTM